ncbi:serine/threonine-protein kinase [Aquisphaera insulae]|uniref:serine/threonine-protein kinase n=1 Tax=Aquisphaera insulae TaxID=2712864 RepID=UPI0013EE3924|nr:serine/threonine-protein kinase [Aquisphaera insulae]
MNGQEPDRDRDPFERVAEEFLARYRAGERPSIDDLADRHPDLAGQIRNLLPALLMIEQDLSIDPEPEPGVSRLPITPEGSSRIGDYRLIRVVGRGGMGVVYEAEQVSLGRRVALKVLPRHVSGAPRALERFRREAKAAARLHHTNIVPVFEVGQEGDVAYFAMQFIQGQGLDQVIDDLRRLCGRAVPAPGAGVTRARASGGLAGSLLAGHLDTPPPGAAASDPYAATEEAPSGWSADRLPLDPRADEPIGSAMLPGAAALSSVDSQGRGQPYFRGVAQIGRQAAAGLAYAHARGVIHRDIKPSNLLLDAAGVVWIADFGLAKSEEDGLTQTGDVLGTLRYMAPERFRGEADPRSDVYALGLTLYELLTLEPAYDSSDRPRFLDRVRDEEPARPRTLDGRIPRDIETIVLKAIEKEPARRYETAEAMGEDLRRFLDDEPIRARRASPTERYARWARRNPVIAILGAALTAVLAATTAGSLVVAGRFARQADRERSLAAAERSARVEANRKAEAELLARTEAEHARAEAQAETYRAMVSEIRALRAGHQPGWRAEALASLARLAAMSTPRRDPAELRTEAAATLATPDFSLAASIAFRPEAGGMLAFSSEGRTLLTADSKGRFDLWDVPGRRHLQSSSGPEPGEGAPVADPIACLPDGRGFVVGATGRGVIFLDARGKVTPLAPITRGGGRPNRLALSGDGRRIAIHWIGDDVTTVHDLASGSALAEFRGDCHAGLSRDGTRIARADGDLLVFDPVGEGKARDVLGPRAGANRFSFSPDDSMLLGLADRAVLLWDVAKRAQVGSLRGHRERVFDAAFSPDGEWIASGSLDYTARVWEARSGRVVVTLPGLSSPVFQVKWSPAGDHLALNLGNSGEVALHAIAGRHSVRWWLAGGEKEIGSVAAHPRTGRLATAGYSELRTWDLASARTSLLHDASDGEAVTAMAYNPDGTLLATAIHHGPGDPSIVVRDARTGAIRARMASPHICYAVTFDPAGGRLATGDMRGDVTVWDLATGLPSRHLRTGSGSIIESIVYLDRPRGLVAHAGDRVILLNPDSDRGGDEAKTCPAGGTISYLAADPGGRLLFAGLEDGSVAALSLPDLTPTARAPASTEGKVRALAVSLDGRLLAVAHDHRVTLHDSATLATLLSLTTWDGTLRDLAFASDRILAVAGTSTDVDVWDLGELRDGLTKLGLAWDRPGPPEAPGPSTPPPRLTPPASRPG